MPEYLAPGVYVEEVSFRAKSIEGLSTTTTGFVGPTRYGPVNLPLDVVTSIGEFERTYGDRQQMQFEGSSPTHNYMWHAARGFFDNGGTRLYIARLFTPMKSPGPNDEPDGRARASMTLSSPVSQTVDVIARFPGDAGNMRVRITLVLGENVLGQDKGPDPAHPIPRARGLFENDVVLLSSVSSPVGSPLSGAFATAHSFFDTAAGEQTWRFTPISGPDKLLAGMHPSPDPLASDQIRVVTATISVFPVDPNLSSLVYSGLALDPDHQLNGLADSIEAQFAEKPNSLGEARTLPIVITVTGNNSGTALLSNFFGALTTLKDSLLDPKSSDVDRSIDIVLAGGNDGQRPPADAYEGTTDDVSLAKTGLMSFEDIDEISIVAAPGSTFGYNGGYKDDASTILTLLIAHAERMRYRIAVLDSGDDQSIADVRALRAKLDSTYAAIYYPWITVLDPVTRKEINLPPSFPRNLDDFLQLAQPDHVRDNAIAAGPGVGSGAQHTETFTFASEKKADGTVERVPVLVVRPATPGRYPVLIVLHGTGGNDHRPRLRAAMRAGHGRRHSRGDPAQATRRHPRPTGAPAPRPGRAGRGRGRRRTGRADRRPAGTCRDRRPAGSAWR